MSMFDKIREVADALDRPHMTVDVSVLGGMKIRTDASLVDVVDDWSKCRSRARAERRRKLGHPQRVETILKPKRTAFQFGDILMMHPELYEELKKHLAKEAGDYVEKIRNDLRAASHMSFDQMVKEYPFRMKGMVQDGN